VETADLSDSIDLSGFLSSMCTLSLSQDGASRLPQNLLDALKIKAKAKDP
jgi:hypothetical protein